MATQLAINPVEQPGKRGDSWWIEWLPGKSLTYNLSRMAGDRSFTFRFDLTKPMAAPTASWSWIGVDFFAYADGGWIKANEIPANESSWGNGAIIHKQTRFRLQELVRKVAQQKNEPGSNTRKLQDFYTSGMDTLA